MQINQPMFVLQRRINQPLGAIERVLCDPVTASTPVTLDDDMVLVLDRPFGVMFPPFGVDHASWSAPASVSTRHGRVCERFDIEINVWDGWSTELLLRPRARHPYRWSGRRMRRYFALAHASADILTCRLGARAAEPDAAKLGAPVLR